MSLIYPCNAGVSQVRVCRVRSASGIEIVRHILDEQSEFTLIKGFSTL